MPLILRVLDGLNTYRPGSSSVMEALPDRWMPGWLAAVFALVRVCLHRMGCVGEAWRGAVSEDEIAVVMDCGDVCLPGGLAPLRTPMFYSWDDSWSAMVRPAPGHVLVGAYARRRVRGGKALVRVRVDRIGGAECGHAGWEGWRGWVRGLLGDRMPVSGDVNAHGTAREDAERRTKGIAT